LSFFPCVFLSGRVSFLGYVSLMRLSFSMVVVQWALTSFGESGTVGLVLWMIVAVLRRVMSQSCIERAEDETNGDERV